jgi:uncharacterized protein (DUF58 family)
VNDLETFLDPTVLARIENLELLARTVVSGFLNGMHKSPHLGNSLDFAEHRVYAPGDDIRRVDWKLYARTDRLYRKEYEADTNTNFSVVLDVSSSMNYGSGPVTKLDYATYLTAAITYRSRGQRARVGLALFDNDLVEVIPPSAKHLPNILHSVTVAKAERPGAMEEPFKKLSEHFRRRSMILVISDFYAEPDYILNAMTHLRQRGNDVMAIHVLDRAELEFPFDEASPFEDLESGEKVPVVPDQLRAEYKKMIRQHIAELEGRLGAQGVDYAMFDTSQPLDYALFHYLSRRQWLARVR